ncbi:MULTISPECIES: hypothetical protein [Amycolatopsis]|uniref:Uncharacterized protein n=1 Tax=Amycolatopsis thermalba TaxID=944492 RepID=A0ABY4NXZ3_9PSEU|nr:MULTISPECIES: hypothetical protein [Amycolatopsis]UQS24944.1 hypothetical protein L1857_20065 [Amycolatopsis thermalba]
MTPPPPAEGLPTHLGIELVGASAGRTTQVWDATVTAGGAGARSPISAAPSC